MVKAWSRPRTNSDMDFGGESRSGMHNPLVQGSNPCGPTNSCRSETALLVVVSMKWLELPSDGIIVLLPTHGIIPRQLPIRHSIAVSIGFRTFVRLH